MALLDLPDDHDIHHLEKILSYMSKFRTAIDGGAHKGIWTRRLLEKFDRVIAFEPHFDNYKCLPKESENYNNALGDKMTLSGLEPGIENTGQWHIAKGDGTVILPLDYFQFTKVDFIKFDVEGYEYFAVQGARKTIARDKPMIMIEENGLCKNYGIEKGDTEKLILDMGYELVCKMNKDYLYRSHS